MKERLTLNLCGLFTLAFFSFHFSACNKAQKASAILAVDSLQSIAFYGRVVDQHGQPVPNAKVRGNVEIIRYWMDQKWDEHFTTTDSNGYFHFSGLHGQALVVSPKKDGYESKCDKSFEYSGLASSQDRHQPDPKAPVVFTIWKQAGAQPLKHEEFDRVGVPVDGQPVSFDLLKGEKTSSGNGDLVVKIVRHPEHIQRGQPFDWSAVIESPSGGIRAHSDQYPYEAPADGYAPQLTIDMPADAPNWQSSVRRSFYLKARDGKLYARIILKITTDYEPPPTGVTIETWANPTGSRNLEFDPYKALP